MVDYNYYSHHLLALFGSCCQKLRINGRSRRGYVPKFVDSHCASKILQKLNKFALCINLN